MQTPAKGTTAFLAGLCLVQILSVLYYAAYFHDFGYLPSPFVYDKSDSFMDFFHVLFWADHPGRYTEWRSVYPPLNFWFMRLVGWLTVDPESISTVGYRALVDHRQTVIQYGGGFALRSSQSLAFAALGLMYVGSILALAVSRLWRGFTSVQRALLFIAVALSGPLLFALERGNLIVLSLPLLAIIFTREGWWRIAALAVLINIKPYFAVLLVGLLLKKKYLEFLLATALAGLIFLVTGMLLDPYFLQFLNNLVGFAGGGVFSGREVLALPSTIAAFAYALTSFANSGSTGTVAGMRISTLVGIISAFNAVALVGATAAFLTFQRSVSLQVVLAFLLVFIANSGVWVGGYSMLSFLVIIPTVMTLRLRWIAMPLLLCIFLPFDALVLRADYIPAQQVFLSGLPSNIEWHLTAATVLRPLCSLALLACITAEAMPDRFYLPGIFARFKRVQG